MMNFENLQGVEKANTKVGTPRGQNFKMRFRKFNSNKGKVESIETKFFISDKLWDKLNLDTKGLKQFNDKNADGKVTKVYLAQVDNEDAVILRKTDKLKEGSKKGRNFKSTLLENALIEAGVLNADIIDTNQRLDLVEAGTDAKGVTFYEIVVDAEQATDNDASEESTDAPEESVAQASSEDNF